MSTASDARAVRTRKLLRDAMLNLIEKRALEQITIRDLSAEAGIGYATFFRHYETKDALLDDLVTEEIDHLLDLAIPLLDARKAKAASVALFEYVNEHRSLWSTFLTGGAASVLRNEMLRLALEIAKKRPVPGNDPPIDVATRLIVGGTIEVLVWWLLQKKPASIEEAARIHYRFVFMPIAGRRAAPIVAQAAPRTTGARRRTK